MEAVHVIGAGGIGSAVGYALCAAGVPVTFVDADPQKVAWGRRDGVAVDRNPPLPAAFEDFADWRPPPDALLLLCTKCYDNAAVLERVPQTCTLLPIQNGFDPALEARVTVEGIASFVSECLPGRPHTRITRAGQLHLGPNRPGNCQAQATARCLAGLLRGAPFRVLVVGAIQPFKYTKLMYNAAISPLAAAAGLDNGQLLRRPGLRRLFFALLQENYAILRGAGVELGKVGPFHPRRVAQILRTPLVARALAWAFYPSLRGTYCSMSGDLPRGVSELENYNGHLLRLAGATPCPLNRRVYALVQRIQRERIPPHPSLLDELASGGSQPPVAVNNRGLTPPARL
jgi:2-dehydropantoate 2-reductase